MSKIPLTREKAIFESPYHDILKLLEETQEIQEEKQLEKGLEPKYIRYVLIKNHGLEKNYTIPKMRDFFSKLQIKTEKDYIKSRQLLNHYLKQLIELELIRKEKQGKKIKYFINKEYFKKAMKEENKDALDAYKINHILDFLPGYTQKNFMDGSMPVKETVPDDKSDIDPRNGIHIIYGISQKMYDSFSVSEKEQIQNAVKEIEKYIAIIENIKLKKLREKTKIIEENFGTFCSPFYSTGISSEGLSPKKWDKLQNKANKEIEKFNKLSIKNICDKMNITPKEFYDLYADFNPISITYSRYGKYISEKILLKKLKNSNYRAFYLQSDFDIQRPLFVSNEKRHRIIKYLKGTPLEECL